MVNPTQAMMGFDGFAYSVHTFVFRRGKRKLCAVQLERRWIDVAKSASHH